MLMELYISDFAIIDRMNIEFSSGLNILSGETGTGKSILINALNLVMGQRAATEWIREGKSTADVLAVFEIKDNKKISGLLKENNIDADNTLIIRRILSKNGKHKVFVNDRPVSLSFLNAMAMDIVSIANQNEHQALLKSDMQLLVIDRYGGLDKERQDFATLFNEVHAIQKEIKRLKKQESIREERRELLQFQAREIDELGILPDEDNMLVQEKQRLVNALRLSEAAHQGFTLLYGVEGAISEQLASLGAQLERLLNVEPSFKAFAERIHDIRFKIDDLARGLDDYSENTVHDPVRLNEVEERLQAIKGLTKKYGGSIEALFKKRASIFNELSQIETCTQNIEEFERLFYKKGGILLKSAYKLSEKRHDISRKLAKEICQELAGLSMKGAVFELDFKKFEAAGGQEYIIINEECVGPYGMDEVVFMFSANIGEPPKDMSRVASGGELSRLLLALKGRLAEVDAVSTVIFDEVDVGIGGVAANMVGEKLSALAEKRQVICITHLPQIASRRGRHFKVDKVVEKGRTLSNVALLDDNGRVEEISRMLGGDHITKNTIEHARDMLKHGDIIAPAGI